MLVLASASPRRQALLKTMGLEFIVDPSDIKEDLRLPLSPKELAIELARQKAQSVADRHPNALILGADTLVVLEGEILGKPHTPKIGLEMLQKLNGRAHEVITGLCVIKTLDKGAPIEPQKKDPKSVPPTPPIQTHAEVTTVLFKNNPLRALQEYATTPEPLDKAGAYAIQGKGGVLIERIEGDYDNVVGLPTTATKTLLERMGFRS